MIKIQLLPLEGIEIEDVGKVLLGQSTAEIEKRLGRRSERSNKKQLFYEQYECRIDLDKNDKAEFIEFIYGPFPEKTALSIYGVDPFRIGADKLIEILKEKNNGQIDDSEADFSFAFLNISVGVWRQMTEKNVEESIAQLRASNEYEVNKEWLDQDLTKAKNFWTIGVGIKNYYN